MPVSNRNQWLKKHWGLLLTVSLSFVVYWRWLSLNIFTKSDLPFYFLENQSERLYTFSWSLLNLGSTNELLWRTPYEFLQGLLGVFHIGVNISDKLLVFWPIMFLLPISSYLLVKKITSNQAASVIGSLVFSYNTYFSAILTQGHTLIIISSAFCLFSLLAFITFLEKDKFVYALFTLLSLGVSAFYDLRITYIAIFVIFGYFLFTSFFESNFLSRYKRLIRVGLLGALFLGLSCYWLFPALSSDVFSNSQILNRSLFGSSFWSLTAAITLFHPFWTESSIQWFTVHSPPLYFWITPTFAFLGLLFNKSREIIFFSLVALLGILLAKQVDQPLSDIYPWLHTNFPGFGVFREATKFYFLIALGYSILIASFIAWWWNDKSQFSKIRILGRYFITALVAGVFLWNTQSMIIGEADAIYTPRSVPKSYLTFRASALDQEIFFRTIWVPRSTRWSFYRNLNPKVNITTMIQSQWLNLLDYRDGYVNLPIEKQILNSFSEPFSNHIFDIASIKYVLVPPHEVDTSYDFFKDFGGSKNPNIRQWYIDQLDKVSWLRRINIGTSDLVVYENEGYKDPISSFASLYSLDSLGNLDQKYGFITDKLGNEFYFVTPVEGASTKPLVNAFNPFENLGPKNISSATLASTFVGDPEKATWLYLKAKDKSTKATISVNASSLSAATSTVLLSLPAGTSTIAYESPLYTYENVLANGSFEMGMWGEKVGDCNKYDDNGLLAMSLNTQEKTDGNQSIQLEATRHIACTSIRTAVASSSTYMLSFDYQSPNAKIASYYVGYNDPAKTSTKEDLKVESASWHSFSKIIEVPSGATTLSLYLYAKSTDRKTNIINRYDNVQLIEVPDLRDAFYLVSEPIGPPLVEPRSVSFDLVNPTKKLVHIKGATAAFFLAMSESYHDQWQLQLNNEKVHGFLEGWWPFAKPDRVGDEYHYKLNGFLNGWYVDTAELCAGSREEVLGTSEIQTACTQNADGSYDIEFVIEFWPQRWFYLGLLISGTTLLGCLGYLGYEGVRRLRRKQYV